MMRRTWSIPTQRRKKKQLKHDEKDIRDRISELSDDVLVKILSFLPSEEAVLKTSFLSHRWKQLWESLPVSFNFDGLMPVRCGAYAKSLVKPNDYRRMRFEDRKREIRKFVGWVNHVLIAYQGSTIDELRVLFYFDKDSWGYVDKWIDIAMKKKVKKLELHFLYFHLFSWWHYPFPQQCFCGSEYLRSLCLKNVGVSDDVTEWILSNCPMLESLHIEGSPLLVDPKVSGSSLRLKHLHLSKGANVRSVEISAPNLVSFEYHEEEEQLRLHIRHAPKLTELYFSSRVYNIDIDDHNPPLSYYLPQLVTLRLSIRIPYLIQVFPTCTNLRHLSCKVPIRPGSRHFSLRPLIEASPFLHKFTLEIKNYNKIKNRLSKVQTAVECSPHKHLKVLEIIGFLGQPMETNFVAYLLKSAIELEKIFFLLSEEAVLKTSFLSQCWKQLWESLPVCFDFDGVMPVRYGKYAKSFENSNDYRRMKAQDMERERCWYDWVLLCSSFFSRLGDSVGCFENVCSSWALCYQPGQRGWLGSRSMGGWSAHIFGGEEGGSGKKIGGIMLGWACVVVVLGYGGLILMWPLYWAGLEWCAAEADGVAGLVVEGLASLVGIATLMGWTSTISIFFMNSLLAKPV
ncbi:hypothetical protein GQ457_02G031560 [Hibiscus cannabinus]